jgi:polar amino acid transport system substrate-binding protein
MPRGGCDPAVAPECLNGGDGPCQGARLKQTSMKRIAPVLAGLWLAACFSAPVAAEEARPIRVATEGAFPPFNYMEGDEPAGFEVELGKALCAAAKARCVFVAHDWDGMIKGLLRNEYDAVMASMAITAKRKERIAFSKPYYRIPATFIARKDSDVSGIAPAALAGKTIATIADSQHARFLEERYPKAEIKAYGKLEEANLDLLAERVDLVLADKLALTKFLESPEGKGCRPVGDAPFDPAFYSAGVAVGLRKDDGALKALFDGAIDAVIADGTYDRIRAKHFSFDTKG